MGADHWGMSCLGFTRSVLFVIVSLCRGAASRYLAVTCGNTVLSFPGIT